jgi:tetratricopeptide (TPR) repeat protein
MIDMERSDLAIMMECGYILVGMQRFKEAKQVFEGIAVVAPDSEIPLVALGSVAFCEGKFKDAVKQYQRALKMNDASPFARAYLGEALFFLGDTDDALSALKGVITDDRDGKAGEFAQSLLEAIEQGFTPRMLSGVEDFEAYKKEQESNAP